jgi:PH domain
LYLCNRLSATSDVDNFQAFENKDAIDRRDMISVAMTTDEKMPFAFELSTTHQQGRVYLLAAETDDDRIAWMIKLAAVSLLSAVIY